MADDKKNPQVGMPANRMRLSEKFQKLKNNINLYTHTEHTEDKGADTQVVEAENNGKIVARFVQKDGKTVESMGSDDAQQSGDFDKIAKKVGAKDGVTHTKPEQVSEIAHDNQPGSVTKDNSKAGKVTTPKVDHKLDNNQEANKASGFINNKAPKEPSKLEKRMPIQTQPYVKKITDQAVADAAGGGAKIPPKAPVAASAPKEPLKKKWQVFMDSCNNNFTDPLKKDPMAKGDVVEFKKPDDGSQIPNTAEKMKRIKESVQRMADRKGWNKVNPETDEAGVPHKFWGAYRKQEGKKERQDAGKSIPKPGEQPKDNVVPMKKATVSVAAKQPTQESSKTQTIKNAEETTINPQPVKSREGLVKDKKPVGSPQIDPASTPQHLPSADQGLEKHLQHLTAALKANEKKLAIASDKTAYGKDVPTAQRDKEIKMAERSLKYLQNGIHLTKIAIQARDSGEPNWNSLVGTGNPKVNHLGILTFGNTLPGHNCPGRGGCGDGSCYGMNGQQAMGGSLELRARNSGLIHRQDFVQGAIQALKNAPKHLNMTIDPETYDQIKDHPRFKAISMADPIVTDKGVKIKVKAGDYVRWHDTGDILNEKHLDDMVKIAQAFPEKKFYAYTKSMHLPLEKLRAQPNFNVVQSLGGQHNDKIDENKPHAKFFNDLESASGAGYTPVWHNDWPAATGVTKIALVPHGARKKEIDVAGFNATPAPAKMDDKVKKSVAPSDHEPAWMTFDQPDSVAQSAAMGLPGKLRALAMVHHKHDDSVDKSSDARANPLTGNVLQKVDKPKIEIVPHPPEVIDVDPEIISNMKTRLAAGDKKENTFRVKLGKKNEGLQKDVVGIKTGKHVKTTQKRVDAQPVAPNAGYPTPSPIKEVNGKQQLGEVSDKIANKFNSPKVAEPDHARVARIQSAMSKIDQLMGELKDHKAKMNRPTLKVVKSDTLGKFEALRKGQPISFPIGSEKLRELRDFVESKGGVVHAKDIKNQPQFRDVKLGTLIDNKGNMTTQSLQSQIDALPKHNFTSSHATIKGTLEHSPAHPNHPQHGQYQAMYGDTGDLIAKQLHSSEPSSVFQLNLSPEHEKALNDAGVMDTFKKFNDTSLKSSHPVNPGNGVGWVRYTDNPDGIFIDEIQSDLGSSPEKNFDKQASDAVAHGAIQPHQVPQMKALLAQHMPEEHRRKINQIIFGDKHPSTVLHEAFHHALRMQGRENTPIHIWSAAGKGSVSLNSADAPEPVHMKIGYDQNPEKMGYKPAAYGEISTQTGPHSGQPTRKTLLRKTKEIKNV